MKNKISTVKGAREFYPEKMAVRTWLYESIRAVSELFGYEEYEAPFLEKLELYAAKSGEELVKEQSFVFPDRGGDMIALRPELTPSLARMVTKKQNELIYPLRWWSFGPFWRYERPQKGRTREFFQWNIDLIGVDTAEADAELVAIAAMFLKKIGFKPDEVQVLINDRQLMDDELAALKITGELKKSVFKLIDRKDKLPHDKWLEFALELGLEEYQVNGINKLLDDSNLWEKSERLKRVFSILDAMGVSEYITFSTRIIRGLDYYTGIVFEAVSLKENGRSVLGGGHYANLVEDVGGKPLTGVGFAMGDVMVSVLLEKYNLVPENVSQHTNIMVAVFNQDYIEEAYRLANELRMKSLNIICYPEATKLGKQYKFASRIGCDIVLVIGPDEIENEQVAIKNMKDGKQSLVDREDVLLKILQMLA
ncbi:MAG: histidine--tRNA ligase [Anaerolineaceae bacterium]|nr:histidine--tRNA ligase [Anaerolineaceae bacterium]